MDIGPCHGLEEIDVNKMFIIQKKSLIEVKSLNIQKKDIHYED